MNIALIHRNPCPIHHDASNNRPLVDSPTSTRHICGSLSPRRGRARNAVLDTFRRGVGTALEVPKCTTRQSPGFNSNGRRGIGATWESWRVGGDGASSYIRLTLYPGPVSVTLPSLFFTIVFGISGGGEPSSGYNTGSESINSSCLHGARTE